jgi:hypothetical protein
VKFFWCLVFSPQALLGQHSTWFVAPGTASHIQPPGLSPQELKALSRKDLPHMSIALRNKHVFALIVLALLTLLALTFILLSTVAHINVWHSMISLVPDFSFRH